MSTLLRLLQRFAIALILALGALSALAYVTTPLLAGLRENLAAALAAHLDVPVSIGGMQPRWRGLGPMLRLRDVTLGSGDATVHLQEARVDLHLPGFWDHTGALRLTLRGMQLRLVRDQDGTVHIHGLPRPAAAAGTQLGVPGRLRLQAADIIWEDHLTGRPPLRIAPVDLDLSSDPDGLHGVAQLVTAHGQVQVAATLNGDLRGSAWSGALRVRAEHLDLATLLGDYLPEHYQLSGLRLNTDLTSTWEQALPTQVQGRMDIYDLRLVGAGEAQFQQLGATLAFARQDTAWQLRLDDLTVRRGGRRWPTAAVAADFTKGPQGQILIRAGASFLRIEDLLALLMVRAPWAELDQSVRDLEPRGELHDLQLALDYGPDHFDWQGAARFAGMHIRQSGSTPGVQNLSGSLRGRTDHLQLDLDGDNLVLDFGDLFRSPLRVDRLQGRLDWVQTDAGWVLRSELLELDTPVLRTRNRLALTAQAGRPLLLDLQSDFRDGDASQAGTYYPVGIMRPKLVEWLDRAIGSGRVTAGTAVVYGPLSDFPFHKTHSGHFEVLFETRDLDLDYRLGWPPLQQIDATLRFHNNALDIALRSARIYDSQVQPTHARLSQLAPAAPVAIRGRVVGPLADPLRLLAESPLQQRFGALVAGLRGSGTAQLDLDFAVPLRQPGEYRLDGTLQFQGAGLELVNWQLPLSDIQGTLDFDLKALRAQGIRARGLNSDLNVAVTPANGATRITAQGTLGLPAIQTHLPKVPLQRASGSSRFDIAVEIPGASAAPGTPTWLEVTSELRGIALDLPAPLGKDAATARRLQVRVPFGGSGAALRVNYQGLFDAALNPDLSRGELRLGGSAAQIPETPLLRLRGGLKALNLTEWLPLMGELNLGAETTPPPLDADLSFGQLQLGPLQLDDLNLTWQQNPTGWQGQIQAQQLAGSFAVPANLDAAPVRLALQHLTVATGAQAARKPSPPGDPNRLDPRGLPAVVLDCEKLVVNKAALGKLQLQTERSEHGQKITELSLQGDAAQLAASGTWEFAPTGPRTQLAGRVTAAELGTLLRELGFTSQLRDAAAAVDFDLSWPGDPALLADWRLDGTLDLALQQGRLIEIDPGVGRVVGLLNFNALQRRLRLDFSDFYKQGLSFDSIQGRFTLNAGDARTDDLTIAGPTGKIEVAGRTGLVTQDLDQLVSVTPSLDATLPVAGTIAGGPVAGLAVLVAQQVMSDQVDRINLIKYSVKGPWVNPEITQLEGGGSLSRLLRPFSGKRTDPAATPAPAKPKNRTGTATTVPAAPPSVPPAPPEPTPAAPAPVPLPAPVVAPAIPEAAPLPVAPPAPKKGALRRFFERLKPEGTGMEVLESAQ